jgi:hypothetical protein
MVEWQIGEDGKREKLHLRGVNRTSQATSTHMLPGPELRDHVSVGQNYAVSDKLEKEAQVPSTCLSPLPARLCRYNSMPKLGLSGHNNQDMTIGFYTN